MTPYTLEPVQWLVLIWLLVRWIRLRDDRLLLRLGVVVRIAAETKFQVLLLGVLVFGPRELLRRPLLWVGAGIGALIALPTLWWQAANDWPQLKMGPMVASVSTQVNRAHRLANHVTVSYDSVMISQVSNMLGALSLVVTARITESIRRDHGLVGEDAAVIVLLGVEPMTVKALAEATGVTHSGAVRMVDRLAQVGLVQRGPGTDGRTVAVTLTDAGVTERDRILAARAEAIEPLMSSLSDSERTALDQALRTLLGAAIETAVAAVRACRLCDEDSCVPRGCPVEDQYRQVRPS